jgi:hypothetical protein
MDLIACCKPASIMTSSISSPVYTDNGSVKLCINVNVNKNSNCKIYVHVKIWPSCIKCGLVDQCHALHRVYLDVTVVGHGVSDSCVHLFFFFFFCNNCQMILIYFILYGSQLLKPEYK